MTALTPEQLAELRAYAQCGTYATNRETLALLDEVERLRAVVERVRKLLDGWNANAVDAVLRDEVRAAIEGDGGGQ